MLRRILLWFPASEVRKCEIESAKYLIETAVFRIREWWVRGSIAYKFLTGAESLSAEVARVSWAPERDLQNPKYWEDELSRASNPHLWLLVVARLRQSTRFLLSFLITEIIWLPIINRISLQKYIRPNINLIRIILTGYFQIILSTVHPILVVHIPWERLGLWNTIRAEIKED
jgi:hypothetical protein